MRVEMNGNCFACGLRNPHGLQLSYSLDYKDRAASTITSVDRRFVGWEDAVHGGITAALLDETMVYACGTAGKLVATANLSVKYRKPVPVETPLLLIGRIVKERSRYITASAEIVMSNTVLAQGEGLFAVLRDIEDIDAYFNSTKAPLPSPARDKPATPTSGSGQKRRGNFLGNR